MLFLVLKKISNNEASHLVDVFCKAFMPTGGNPDRFKEARRLTRMLLGIYMVRSPSVHTSMVVSKRDSITGNHCMMLYILFGSEFFFSPQRSIRINCSAATPPNTFTCFFSH